MKYITIYNKETDEVLVQMWEDENGFTRALCSDDYVIIVDGDTLINSSEEEDEEQEE